jgi:hypothetical protein
LEFLVTAHGALFAVVRGCLEVKLDGTR